MRRARLTSLCGNFAELIIQELDVEGNTDQAKRSLQGWVETIVLKWIEEHSSEEEDEAEEDDE